MPDNEREVEREKGRSKLKGMVVAAVIIFLIGVGVFFYIRYKRTHITTDDAYVRGHIHWISPRIYGTVIKVLIDDNQFVKKGQILVVLDPAKYKVRLSQARAKLSLAEAKLKEANVNVQVSSAEVALNRAEFDNAVLDLDRAKEAYPSRVISKQQYDHSLTAYKVAKAKLLTSQQKLKFAEDQVKSATAQVRVCEAAIEAARLDLRYTKIRAPVDGYITKKSVETGNRVGPQTPLFAIVPLNDIWVVANYKENQLQSIHPGQDVEIEITTYPNEKFCGKVESIQAGSGAVFSLFPPENATGNWVKITQRIPVKIEILPPYKKVLRIGMSAETTILLK